MGLPPFVEYEDEAAYRSHFQRVYCRGTIRTFDGINVRFRLRQFDHCFFESSGRDRIKDAFSLPRARRIDWIKAALRDPEAELYEGWDRDRRRSDPDRRVAILVGEYVVIIAIKSEKSADFVTAYFVQPAPPGQLSTIQRIRRGKRWKKENR
jgi:hypothetical protein